MNANEFNMCIMYFYTWKVIKKKNYWYCRTVYSSRKSKYNIAR